MNIEKLQSAVATDTKTIAFHGVELRMRKLGALDGVELHKLLPPDDASFDPALLMNFYTFAISKSLVDESGQLDSDSDANRDALSKFPLAYLKELAEECLQFSGLNDAKKNESGPSLSDSLTGSAATSESSTPNS